MEYRKINREDKKLIDSYLASVESDGSTYSLAYLTSWDFNFDNMYIADNGDGLVMKFEHEGINKYLATLTSLENFPRVVDEILQEDKDGAIIQVEREYLDMLDADKYNLSHNEDYDEYLYLSEDLISLKGKRYHGKRNHIKKFLSLYPDYIFRDYIPTDRQGVMDLFTEWESEKDMELKSERDVIVYMLDHMEELGLIASVVIVGDKIIGFTLGEILSSNVAIVHIEKGDISYEGIYPFINMMFASKYFTNVRYINRQEDLGIEGLRKSKRSYYPIKMSEKWKITAKHN